MYEKCEYWNELTNMCELRKHLEAIGLAPIFPIERPPEEHIKDYCTTKHAKDCWKREEVEEMINDSIFIEDFPEYITVKQILWNWLKWAAIISIVILIIIAAVISWMYLTSGSFH